MRNKMTDKVRYGAGGSIYIEKVDPVKAEEEALKVSYRQSKAAKAEREAMDKDRKKKKKKKVIQEIMGDDLRESKEMLDEII